MKTAYTYNGLITFTLLALTGCATNRSPIAVEPGANTTGFSEAVVLGGAAAGGAAGGYAISHSALGAAAGAGVGLIGGAVVNNLISEARVRREEELVETAKRQTRSAILDEYWQAERYDRAKGQAVSTANQEVHYPGGYFEGINLGPRRAGAEDPLVEPPRG